MLRTKVLIAISIGTLFYVFTSMTLGQSSFWAMEQLEEQKQKISVNAANIAKINENLTMEYNGLKYDMDVVAAYARRLGYVGENEVLVKISGLPTHYKGVYDVGTVMRRTEIEYIPEWMCKLVGCVVGTLVLLIQLILVPSRKVAKSFKRKSSYEAGIRTSPYDNLGIKVETI